jgi:hypothetical protein
VVHEISRALCRLFSDSCLLARDNLFERHTRCFAACTWSMSRACMRLEAAFEW